MRRRLTALFLSATAALAIATLTAATPPAAPQRSAPLRFVVGPTGNEVRYRVREQLAGFDFPNDAIGKSSAVTGGLTIGDDGAVIAEQSKFTVDASTFASDRDRRDNYVRTRLLQSEQFPMITLEPTAIRGLSLPLPASGSRSVELVGNLTVKGVTRPTTWRATAAFENGTISGTATTGFTFADFRMEKPRVRSVLSVADSIHLEYDFTLIPSAVTP
jgi:polyisoprenoid-binding protein YceI